MSRHLNVMRSKIYRGFRKAKDGLYKAADKFDLDDSTASKETSESITDTESLGIFDFEKRKQLKANFKARYWGPTKDLPSKSLIDLALKVVDPEGELGGVGVFVAGKKQGAFNTVYMVQFVHGFKLAIKVPSAGHAARWTDADASNLRSEALTMRYIKKHTNGKVPVPDVYCYSTTLDNEIGAPYIVMEAVEGVPATDIWDPEEDMTVDTIQTQHDLLKSLAEAMAGLQALDFDKAGMLDFEGDDLDKPIVGPVLTWHYASGEELEDPAVARQTRIIPPASTAKEYFSTLSTTWAQEDHAYQKDIGIMKVASKAVECYPLRKSSKSPSDLKETFVLQHPDFNLQNILCDPKTGKVKAIIDWDLVKTVPRCIGYASFPIWLREDWLPNYLYPVHSSLSVEMLDMFRDHYAECLSNAMGGKGDCVYTKKSHIYTALDNSMFGNGILEDFSRKVLQYIFPCQHPKDFMWYLGSEEKGGECEDDLMIRLSVFLDTKDRHIFDAGSDDSDSESPTPDTQAVQMETKAGESDIREVFQCNSDDSDSEEGTCGTLTAELETQVAETNTQTSISGGNVTWREISKENVVVKVPSHRTQEESIEKKAPGCASLSPAISPVISDSITQTVPKLRLSFRIKKLLPRLQKTTKKAFKAFVLLSKV